MGYFSFPHTRTYDSDLGWLIKHLKGIDEKLDEYLENSVITFADPIQWNITEQYPALTMVIDSDGTAYLSKQPVPAGVDISNTDYWMPVFNYNDNINQLRSQIAYNAEENNTTSVNLSTGDLVFWKGIIYKVLNDMPAGSAFVIGSNIEQYTVDDKFGDVIAEAANYTDGEIATVNNTIGLINDEINTINNDIGTINGQITTIGNDITNLGNDITSLGNDLDKAVFWITPEEYGAAGDGVTDDTAAIQAMFDATAPNDHILFTKPRYLVTSTIHINTNYLSIAGGFIHNEYYPAIYTTGRNLTLIHINASGINFSNMMFIASERNNDQPNTAIVIDVDDNVHNGNADMEFINCAIGDFETGLSIKGRNVNWRQGIFSQCRIAIQISPLAALQTDNRGYIIDSVRFHSCACAIDSRLLKDNRSEYISVSGCVADFCPVFYQGCGANTVIQGNLLAYSYAYTTTMILVTRGSIENYLKPMIICDNTFLTGDVESTTGNVFTRDAITVATGVHGVTIKNNRFYNFGRYAIFVQSQCFNIDIIDNYISNCGNANNDAPIYIPGNSTSGCCCYNRVTNGVTTVTAPNSMTVVGNY